MSLQSGELRLYSSPAPCSKCAPRGASKISPLGGQLAHLHFQGSLGKVGQRARQSDSCQSFDKVLFFSFIVYGTCVNYSFFWFLVFPSRYSLILSPFRSLDIFGKEEIPEVNKGHSTPAGLMSRRKRPKLTSSPDNGTVSNNLSQVNIDETELAIAVDSILSPGESSNGHVSDLEHDITETQPAVLSDGGRQGPESSSLAQGHPQNLSSNNFTVQNTTVDSNNSDLSHQPGNTVCLSANLPTSDFVVFLSSRNHNIGNLHRLSVARTLCKASLDYA